MPVTTPRPPVPSGGGGTTRSRSGPVPDTSWAARFGTVILQGGIAALPTALYTYQGQLALSAQEVWLVSAILAHKWDTGLPRPSLKGLAVQASTDLKWLRELRARLERQGYLIVRAEHNPQGGQLANSYDFAGLFLRLEELIAGDPQAVNPIQDAGAPAESPTPPGSGTSFVARYGRVVAHAGIAAIPQALFTYQATLHLSAQQIWFIAYILAYKWTADLPFPSLHRMAERTGYSRRQIQNIKDSLVAAGFLQIIPRVRPETGRDTNGYDFGPLFAELSGLQQAAGSLGAPEIPETPPALDPLPPARRGRRRAVAGGNGPAGGVKTILGGGLPYTTGEGLDCTWGEGSKVHLEREEETAPGEGVPLYREEGLSFASRRGVVVPGVEARGHQGSGEPYTGGGGQGALGGRVWLAPEEETVQEEPAKKDDSNRAAEQNNPETIPRYSPYISGIVLDDSRELGDATHGTGNVTRALRLWQISGLAEVSFVELLHEAKGRVRLYQGKQGAGRIANRMAYYFRTLESLLVGDMQGDGCTGLAGAREERH